jgi:hypothetical protein
VLKASCPGHDSSLVLAGEQSIDLVLLLVCLLGRRKLSDSCHAAGAPSTPPARILPNPNVFRHSKRLRTWFSASTRSTWRSRSPPAVSVCSAVRSGIGLLRTNFSDSSELLGGAWTADGQGEQGGQDQQGEQGGGDQAADDHGGQGALYLRAGRSGQGHGQEAEAGDQGGH